MKQNEKEQATHFEFRKKFTADKFCNCKKIILELDFGPAMAP